MCNELKQRLGSFSLFEEQPLRELINLAHEHGVYVSTVCTEAAQNCVLNVSS
jgi:collagenase-like PrtC family protease